MHLVSDPCTAMFENSLFGGYPTLHINSHTAARSSQCFQPFQMMSCGQQYYKVANKLRRFIENLCSFVHRTATAYGQALAAFCRQSDGFPDSKIHGANMGPTWVLSAPGGPHVGPMNLAIWVSSGPVYMLDWHWKGYGHVMICSNCDSVQGPTGLPLPLSLAIDCSKCSQHGHNTFMNIWNVLTHSGLMAS